MIQGKIDKSQFYVHFYIFIPENNRWIRLTRGRAVWGCRGSVLLRQPNADAQEPEPVSFSSTGGTRFKSDYVSGPQENSKTMSTVTTRAIKTRVRKGNAFKLQTPEIKDTVLISLH